MKNIKKYFITSKGEKIRYLYVPCSKKITLVFFHGLMSDITGKKINFLLKFCDKFKIGFLSYEYSGHGKSSGNFEECGIDDWIRQGKEIIKAKINNHRLILVGSSCGGWIGAKMIFHFKKIMGYVGIAAAADFTKFLLWNSFTNKVKKKIISGKIHKLKNEYDGYYPISKKLILGGKKNLILHKKKNCNFPVRFLHGAKDNVVPLEYSIKLSKTLNSNNSLILVQSNGDHSLSKKNDLDKLGQELRYILKNRS